MPHNNDHRIGRRYTVRGAAKHLKVSEETVRRYIREGKLRARKVRSVGLKTVWAIDHEQLAKLAGGSS